VTRTESLILEPLISGIDYRERSHIQHCMNG